MKKWIALLLALLLLLVFSATAFAGEDQAEYDRAYAALQEAGFPVDKMDEESLFAIYTDIKDADSVIVDTGVASLAHALPGKILPPSGIRDGFASCITTGQVIREGRIASLIVFYSYEWDSLAPLLPISEDIFTISWNADAFDYDVETFAARQYSRVGTLKAEKDSPDLASQGSLSVYADLGESSYGTYGNCHFSLFPKEDMLEGDVRGTVVHAVYGHTVLVLFLKIFRLLLLAGLICFFCLLIRDWKSFRPLWRVILVLLGLFALISFLLLGHL
ncbi:MAG: hypothetical protein IJP07_03005 [Firmicutes bacterium]|nr:hypothetical protein [Bacillota bacterium]